VTSDPRLVLSVQSIPELAKHTLNFHVNTVVHFGHFHIVKTRTRVRALLDDVPADSLIEIIHFCAQLWEEVIKVAVPLRGDQ